MLDQCKTVAYLAYLRMEDYEAMYIKYLTTLILSSAFPLCLAIIVLACCMKNTKNNYLIKKLMLKVRIFL
uniref:Uncharacterized protein n=2 Tax=Arundo donax TaxID=35708 RepID=A0A0A9DWT8_ARUDO